MGEERGEVLLHGGIANEGQVFRVGDTVRRPQQSWSSGTHALLLHLEAVGFAGAPRFLGVDSRGREVLSYVPGSAVVPPYPEWGLTDEALVSVAELLRAFHEAVSTFDARPHAWPPAPPEGFVQGVVTHNDLNLDNVVFRDGRAVAFIDFDLSGPGSPVWDVACAARLWAPLRPDVDIADSRRGRGLERFRLFVDGYGLDDADRVRVAEGAEQNFRWFCELISSSAAAGHAAFANYWRSVPPERVERTDRWFTDNAAALRAALGV
jgi:aminoglycoside phosphotransferase (APT) family kinase protein